MIVLEAVREHYASEEEGADFVEMEANPTPLGTIQGRTDRWLDTGQSVENQSLIDKLSFIVTTTRGTPLEVV